MRVREAEPGDVAAVLNVLDGAALTTEYELVREGVDGDAVLVAVGGDDADGTVLGALLLDGDRIEAVAVRPNRRGQGIGTALVAAAADRRERLVAEFDADVRPFYERLGFTIERVPGTERYRGVRRPA